MACGSAAWRYRLEDSKDFWNPSQFLAGMLSLRSLPIFSSVCLMGSGLIGKRGEYRATPVKILETIENLAQAGQERDQF